jgi:hypothetical protein
MELADVARKDLSQDREKSSIVTKKRAHMIYGQIILPRLP